ncbi:hypothetical protein [Terasakiella pusilla]|uniref:hypothetical protein n=1 Tax=Terasakiella pusilla TaxID=64973 RepID=UPI00048D2DC1|nr:hypothetical protein [Terasakiella pusilla]
MLKYTLPETRNSDELGWFYILNSPSWDYFIYGRSNNRNIEDRKSKYFYEKCYPLDARFEIIWHVNNHVSFEKAFKALTIQKGFQKWPNNPDKEQICKRKVSTEDLYALLIETISQVPQSTLIGTPDKLDDHFSKISFDEILDIGFERTTRKIMDSHRLNLAQRPIKKHPFLEYLINEAKALNMFCSVGWIHEWTDAIDLCTLIQDRRLNNEFETEKKKFTISRLQTAYRERRNRKNAFDVIFPKRKNSYLNELEIAISDLEHEIQCNCILHKKEWSPPSLRGRKAFDHLLKEFTSK